MLKVSKQIHIPGPPLLKTNLKKGEGNRKEISCKTAKRFSDDLGSFKFRHFPHWLVYFCVCMLLLIFFLFKFIYLWLCCVFIATLGLSLIVVSGGYSLLMYAGFSLQQLLLLQITGSRPSVVVAHGFSGSMACGIFLDQGSNPCPLHWQADFYPLRHSIYFSNSSFH